MSAGAPSALQSVDWHQPWFESVAAAAQHLHQPPAGQDDLNEQARARNLTNHCGLPLRFVPQSALPDGMAYEAFIDATGQVPTRDNLHDLFNALVWLSFPRIKQQLNALQAAHIQRHGIGQRRGAIRDAATLFDENAALLVTSEHPAGEAWRTAIRQHQWHEAFQAQRSSFGNHAAVWLFGHALMEKLVRPYKSITAHAWLVTAPVVFFALSGQEQRAWLDQQVAGELAALSATDPGTDEADRVHPRRFTPLPVLGLPGWWPQQDAAFYDDAAVFRPRRPVTQ